MKSQSQMSKKRIAIEFATEKPPPAVAKFEAVIPTWVPSYLAMREAAR